MPSEPLRDKTIVVTGVTGQVAGPVYLPTMKETGSFVISPLGRWK